MRVDYVSFDGRRFETKEECLQYESRGRFITGWTTYEQDLTNYNNLLADLNPTSYRFSNSSKDIIDNCTIVYIENDESLKLARSIDASLEKGFNFWNGYKFISAEILIGNYRQAIANMESLIKVLKKEIGIED